MALRNVSGNASIIEKLNEKMNILHKEMTMEDVAIEMGFLLSMEYRIWEPTLLPESKWVQMS